MVGGPAAAVCKEPDQFRSRDVDPLSQLSFHNSMPIRHNQRCQLCRMKLSG